MSRYASPPHPLPPNPIGWFAVGLSHELRNGDVREVSALGRELALFRNSNGAVGLLDAYCPHVGTHLGAGGVVDGESLRCPFHRWAFAPDGTCTDIPYAKKIPPAARAGS
ncbi:MAG: Rieske 2Fe-2S domain-containing protein, partial [Pseudonocardiales bacterium]|nr:Rieske 2Fe-2S domain-containing protein [Pseudonocardiales bacterium]